MSDWMHDLHVEVARLTAENADLANTKRLMDTLCEVLTSERNATVAALSAAESRATAAEARVEGLETSLEALLDYPNHDDRCAVFAPGPLECSCGLDRHIAKALAMLAKGGPDAP